MVWSYISYSGQEKNALKTRTLPSRFQIAPFELVEHRISTANHSLNCKQSLLQRPANYSLMCRFAVVSSQKIFSCAWHTCLYAGINFMRCMDVLHRYPELVCTDLGLDTDPSGTGGFRSRGRPSIVSIRSRLRLFCAVQGRHERQAVFFFFLCSITLYAEFLPVKSRASCIMMIEVSQRSVDFSYFRICSVGCE